jgi:hypothetical protein
LVLEPNLRLSIKDIKKHRFFSDIDWEKVKRRQLDPVPFKPDPNKYKDLLSNEYETVSNLKRASVWGAANKQARAESPKKGYFLGDISLYKINKEFEDF